MVRIAKVIGGTFELPSGKVVETGSTAWLKWLELPETRSFRFEGDAGGFTARKEKVKKQDGYWSAYASVLGKTRKKYLGKAVTLTQERMLEVEAQLHNLHNANKITEITQPLPNLSLGKTYSEPASIEKLDVEGLKAEILAELRAELHRELGKALAGVQRLGESRIWGQKRLRQ